MQKIQCYIIILACILCANLLCACDIHISIDVPPTPAQTPQHTQAQTEALQTPTPGTQSSQPSQAITSTTSSSMQITTPEPSITPAPMPDASTTPSTKPDPSKLKFPSLNVEREIEEMCTDLGIYDFSNDPANFADAFDPHSIAYHYSQGTIYAKYSDSFKREACFYLASDSIHGYHLNTCYPYESGWLAFSASIPIEDIPADCELISGAKEAKLANLLFLISKDGIINRTYAIPCTENMTENSLFLPKTIGKYLCIYTSRNDSILFDPQTGRILDTGEFMPHNIVAINANTFLYARPTDKVDSLPIACYDLSGTKLGETSVSSWLAINTASNGKFFMTRSSEEKDIIIGTRSYPVYFLSDRYTFDECVKKNQLYDIAISKLQEQADRGCSYQIDSLSIDAVSESHYQLLCGVSVFKGDEIVSLLDYVLIDIKIWAGPQKGQAHTE